MNTDALLTYLDDHRAGSVGAIELLEHLVDEDGRQGPLPPILELIQESQTTLDDLFRLLDATPSPIKRAGAWLTEKLGRLKMGVSTREGLGRLEALEALCLGIQGQIALWRSLGMIAAGEPRIRHVDFGQLEQRARRLHMQVEALRLAAVRSALD